MRCDSHEVNGDEVGLAEQVLLAHVVDAGFLALLRRQVLAPGDHLHAERLGDAGGAGAELAEAEDAERQAVEVEPIVVCQRTPAFIRAFS